MGQKAKTNKYNDFLFLLRLPLKLQRHKPETIKLSTNKSKLERKGILLLLLSINLGNPSSDFFKNYFQIALIPTV